MSAVLLLPAVIAAWAAAVVYGGRSAVFAWWGAAGVALLLALGVLAQRRRWMSGTGSLSQLLGRWSWSAVAALAVACAVGVSSGLQAQAFHSPPWESWTQQRAHIHAVVHITTPARPVALPAMWESASEQQRAGAVVVTARNGEHEQWHLHSRVQVSGPVSADSELWSVGDVIEAEFRVSPGEERTGTMARLSLIDAPIRSSPGAGWTPEVHRKLASALARPGGDAAALVAGMTMGDDSALSAEATTAMRSAGLSHLTAVSGANMAIVVGAVFWLARGVGISRRISVVPAVAAVLGYLAITGLEPSVLRASAMAGLLLVGIVLGGGRSLSALQVTIIGLLIIDPRLAFSRGFALSCAATGGLIVVTPWLVAAWRRGPSQRVPAAVRAAATVVVSVGAVALSAALATAPLLAAYGQGLSWVSLVANMAASPFAPVITIMGLLTGVTAFVSIPVAGLLATCASIPAALVLGIAQWGAGVSGARLPWGSGALGALTLLAAVAVVFVLGRRWPSVRIGAAAVVVGGALLAARLPGWLVRPPPTDWAFVICDVGQGDAALLRTGERSAVVLDAGPEPDSAVTCLQRNRIEQVDAVLLTHLHADHVTGVAAVLERYRPAHLLLSDFREPAESYRQVMTAAHASNTQVRGTGSGDELRAGWLHWRVLAPVSLLHTGSAPNNNSVAILAAVVRDGAAARALFGGDMEAEEQTMMIRTATTTGLQVDVDMVKVPHHGSANQHPRLPAWSGGELAVMSCGDGNDYGHPAPSTVADWERVGATVLRTDQVGDVLVRARADGFVVAETRRVLRPWQPTS